MRSRMAFIDSSRTLVPFVNPRANSPAVQWRGDLEQRKDQGDQRQKQHLRPIDERRQPEWQVLLQERWTRLEVQSGRFVQRELDEVGRRESSRANEPFASLVRQRGRFDEQRNQRVVQFGRRDEIGGR